MSKPCVRTSALLASAVAVAGMLAACGGATRSHTGTAAAGAHTHPSTVAGGRATPSTTAARGRTQPVSRVVVAISSRRSGHSLPAAFVGLAMEDWTLTKHQFAHTDLRRYLLALGPRGLLRIGGNSLDRSFWTSRHERSPRWAQGTATPASLRALAAVLHGTGWRVILGVNLLHFDPARAVDEARSATRILGARLAAIEIGNEPDRYGISETSYLREFRRYVRALRTALPGVGVAGPDASSGGRRWLATFAGQQARARQITLLTFHNYPESACDGRRPTIAELLGVRAERSERAAADAAVAGGRLDRVPATIDETNSAVCWGAPGTSDVFASALWSLDYTLLLAHAGLASVEFQGRIAGCAPYSPLCTDRHGAALFARPDFYGLLAVQQLVPGCIPAAHRPRRRQAARVRAPGDQRRPVGRARQPCRTGRGSPAPSRTGLPVSGADRAANLLFTRPGGDRRDHPRRPPDRPRRSDGATGVPAARAARRLGHDPGRRAQRSHPPDPSQRLSPDTGARQNGTGCRASGC